jgi:hypothetical protein
VGKIASGCCMRGSRAMMRDLSRAGMGVNSEVESGGAPKTRSIFFVQSNGNPARRRIRQPERLRSPRKPGERLTREIAALRNRAQHSGA